MIVKLLTEHHLQFLSLKGCRGLLESTLVKMSNCWKSPAAAQMCIFSDFYYSRRLMQGAELDTPLFDQLVHHVMWDLVMMACQEYKKQVSERPHKCTP